MSRAEAEFSLSREEVLRDYRLAFASRQASLAGRKEVLGGKAKFGIFGDGKELAQIAMARVFRRGDWRAGYYRDQTFMFALEEYTFTQFFAQLYAHADSGFEPASGGRQMGCHFASRFLGSDEVWLDQTGLWNTSADISSTGGQMARLLGLAYASHLYRQSPILQKHHRSTKFSRKGSELAFGTIGNASTSQGLFWEALNAAGVLQVPMLLSVWDDGYGISVPNRLQTTKGSVYELLSGFRHSEGKRAFDLYQVRGDDYGGLIRTYRIAAERCRDTHAPAVIHVCGMTQPLGHSTSGSHGRYKEQKRLRLEEEWDCIRVLRRQLQDGNHVSPEEIGRLEEEAAGEVRQALRDAWAHFQAPLERERDYILPLLRQLQAEKRSEYTDQAVVALTKPGALLRKHLHSCGPDCFPGSWPGRKSRCQKAEPVVRRLCEGK